MRTAKKSQRGGQVKPARILLRMSGNFLQNRNRLQCRLPLPDFTSLGRIQYDPRNIEWPFCAVCYNLMRSEALSAPVAELLKRNGRGCASGNVYDSVRRGDFCRNQLFFDQG